jgi:hypothetical protein
VAQSAQYALKALPTVNIVYCDSIIVAGGGWEAGFCRFTVLYICGRIHSH